MRRITATARLTNAVLSPLTPARRDPERALRAWKGAVDDVCERTGAELGADAPFADDLGFTLQCFARVEDLTPIGWLGQLGNATARLENRLRVSRLFAERPEIADEAIDDPVFVVGLPRTATTLTHRILARSEPHRGPLLWELFHTGLEATPAERDRVVKSVSRQLNATFKFSPAYDVIHPVRADQPEESIAIMPRTYFPLSCALMDDYREWLAGVDLTDDYRYLKRALQVLQHGRERRRWILKFPGHVAHLDHLHRTFPGARIVWTHRDPVTVVGSFCSLVETLGGLHCKRIDPHEIGRMWLGVLAESIERGRELRPTLPRESIVDVDYHRLVADPHRTVPELYERLDAEWTAADEANLDGVLAGPNRDRRHEYSLARYGLTGEDVEQAFGDYPQMVAGLRA